VLLVVFDIVIYLAFILWRTPDLIGEVRLVLRRTP
jgi:hypothetical protein